MNDTDWTLVCWSVLMMIAGFAGSALYSGLETGAYSLNRVRMHILDQQGIRAAQHLRELLEHPTALLTTLLVGNNLTNYIGTAGIAVLLEGCGFSLGTAVLLNTVIASPLLFVFGETLPKDLFSAYSDQLMYRLTPVLGFSQRILTWTGFVPLLGHFTRLLTKPLGDGARFAPLHPRRQVEALVKEGVGYGLLSQEQSAIVGRVLHLANRSVGDEMVPWSQVTTVHIRDEPATLRDLARRTGRSRFPVLDEGGQVAGIVDATDALLHPTDRCPSLSALMGDANTLDSQCPLRQGLSRLQRRPDALAIVTDPSGKPVGVVTIKDLVEPITGELANW